jgi:hypothetical protein
MEQRMADQSIKLGKQELEFLDGVADGLANTDMLITGTADSNRKIGFADLYAYATNPHFTPDPALVEALEGDVQLMSDFQRLLSNTAVIRMPQVAAASSGERTYREADGCKIVFKESRADPAQVFVIIELINKQAALPMMMFICHPDDSCRRVILGDSVDGRIQLLVDRDSHIVRGLSEVSTEVYLR